MSQFCAKAEKGKKVSVPTFQLSSFPHLIPHLAFLHHFLFHSPSPLNSPLQPPPPSVFIATRPLYLPSDGATWFIGWGWLKDPLLLLWRQRGVKRDDLDITDFRPQVVDLPLDSLAGFINFLKDGSATINPGVTCVCKQQTQNRLWTTPGWTMAVNLDDRGRCKKTAGETVVPCYSTFVLPIAPSDGGN